ncbi:PHOsphatase [Mortierella claussenii]|nr:PHOsphatase [Mortierella claussenii]
MLDDETLASLRGENCASDTGAVSNQQDEPRSIIPSSLSSTNDKGVNRGEGKIKNKPDSEAGLETMLLPLSWLRRHLGTKSPYPHDDRPVGPLNDIPKGHELAQLHLICRHGTRYPSVGKSLEFQRLSEKMRQVAVPGFEWLERWPSEKLYPITMGNLLAVKGDSDLYQIGRRFAIRYKELLDRYPYEAGSYRFQSSVKSRCSQSAYGFSVGFLEGRHNSDPGSQIPDINSNIPPVQPVDIFTLPIGLDQELAVKYACPRWLESVKDGPDVMREVIAFQETFLPSLAEQLSTMFSLNDGPSSMTNITTKDVQNIYDICGFEVAFYNNDQTWCQLLRKAIKNAVGRKVQDVKSNFLKLEISKDLDDYYTHGPGVPFNKHLGCKLGTSISDAIEMALNPDMDISSALRMKRGDDDATPRVSRGLFKFGHSETILFFSSFLGLYDQKGIPLRGDMTPEQYANREFKTSKFSPFAANMAFEVYRPKIGGTRRKNRLASFDIEMNNEDHSEQHASSPQLPLFGMKSSTRVMDTPKGLVRLLVNEVPMLIPGCGSNYFCKWSTFKNILLQAGAGCDFDGCCTSLGPTAALAEVMQQEEKAPICLTVEPIVA